MLDQGSFFWWLYVSWPPVVLSAGSQRVYCMFPVRNGSSPKGVCMSILCCWRHDTLDIYAKLAPIRLLFSGGKTKLSGLVSRRKYELMTDKSWIYRSNSRIFFPAGGRSVRPRRHCLRLVTRQLQSLCPTQRDRLDDNGDDDEDAISASTSCAAFAMLMDDYVAVERRTWFRIRSSSRWSRRRLCRRQIDWKWSMKSRSSGHNEWRATFAIDGGLLLDAAMTTHRLAEE